MSGDAFRLTVTLFFFWLGSVSAPRVLAGDSWGHAVAASLTGLAVGLVFAGVVFVLLVLFHDLFKTIRARYQQRVLTK